MWAEPDDLTLAAGPLRLVLRPAWGGRVAAFDHATRGAVLRPITGRRFDPERWPRAGAYPLIPFHNRVEGARFVAAGRAAVLPAHPDCTPHALHGIASRLPWHGCATAPARAVLSLMHPAGPHWPWRFTARQTFTLDPRGLTLALALTNLDTAPMPAGLGWHPYLPAPARIETDAILGWPLRPDLLPAAGPVPAADVTGPTRYLAGWRRVRIGLRRGLAVVLHRAQDLPHLVVHAPPGPHACVEPVSHLAGALNQPDLPGMGPLPPGATLRARVRLEVVG